MEDQVRELTTSFERIGARDARIALVLGSGLGGFSRRLRAAREFPYAELAGMPRSAVPGHAGRLVLGEVSGVQVAVFEGRVHRYEGWSVEDVTRSVRALAALGVAGLVLTNAAGGLDPQWRPPLLMRITDHVDLQSTRLPFPSSALQRGERCAPIARELQRERVHHRHPTEHLAREACAQQNSSPNDTPYDTPYDAVLGRALELAAREAGIPLVHGIYAGLLGPSYETPAEIRMLRWLGASAVGMSTVAEAAAACAAGMRVAAVSCITNAAAGIASGKLTHEEVVAAGASIAESFSALLEAAVPRVAAALDAS